MSSSFYRKLVINLKADNNNEIIQAWLSSYEVDAIVDNDNYLEVYRDNNDYDILIQRLLIDTNLQSDQFEIKQEINKNWNAEWEANFQPININNKLLVRATFHKEQPQLDYELIISPKMAFGTGHHPTTYMMLDFLLGSELENKTILDYGCGTGILGVFALIKKAKVVEGVDIQTEAIDNCMEHCQLNGIDTERFKVKLGDLEVLDLDSFDLILANINRKVLESKALALKSLLKPKGQLLVSGILNDDFKLINDLYESAGFVVKDIKNRGEWTMIHYTLVV